jgi:hypothetical protein
MLDKLTVGAKVHYVHPNGTHSEAEILHVHNHETGTSDLFVRRNDHIQDNYAARVVVYSKEPKPYSWHFVDDDPEPA